MNKSIPFLLVLFITACGSGGGDSAVVTNPDMEGNWSGMMSSDKLVPTPVRLSFQVLGGTFNGEFSAQNGYFGNLSGNVSSTVISFIQLNNQLSGCTGTYTGTGSFTQKKMSITFTGSDCKGDHAGGIIELTRI